MTKSSFPIMIAAMIVLLCGGDAAFAQCGADGKQPCNPTPKTTTPKKITPKTTTPKKTIRKTTTVSKPKPTTKKPPTTVSKPQPIFVASAPEIEMVKIPSGSFMMGSENGDDSEKPVHRVNISSSFYMGKYEVTQTQWKAVMGNNPSSFSDCGGDCPVEQVSWEDAQEFIRKLNDLQIEFEYRLPTEAEWEYACRAGTTGDYAGNLDEMAWYYNNSGDQTLSGEFSDDKLISNNNGMDYVGVKQANAWGLYDMHGNVWEWCEDWYEPYSGETVTNPTGSTSGSFRVSRGGSWADVAGDLRSAFRTGSTPSDRDGALGFRVVRN